MNLRILYATIILIEVVSNFAQAQVSPSSNPGSELLDFDFSFDGVSGEIVGAAQGISTPDLIVIDTAPESLQIATPLSLIPQGTITVQGDTIIAVNTLVVPLSSDGILFELNGTDNLNTLTNYNVTAQIINFDGFSGVNYTYAGVDQVPEPSDFVLLLLGCFALFILRRFISMSILRK
jgi:hypothetical protein